MQEEVESLETIQLNCVMGVGAIAIGLWLLLHWFLLQTSFVLLHVPTASILAISLRRCWTVSRGQGQENLVWESCVSFPGEVALNYLPTANQRSSYRVQPGEALSFRAPSGACLTQKQLHPWQLPKASWMESHPFFLPSTLIYSSWHFPSPGRAGLVTAARGYRRKQDLRWGSTILLHPLPCRSFSSPSCHRLVWESQLLQLIW